MTEDDDPLLSEREMAALIGVQPQTLSVWRSTKRYQLAYIKVGRRVKYRKSVGLKFLESRTVSA